VAVNIRLVQGYTPGKILTSVDQCYIDCHITRAKALRPTLAFDV